MERTLVGPWTPATAFAIVGNMCKVATILVNTVIWDQHSDSMGIVALMMCLGSGALYSQAPLRSSTYQEREICPCLPRPLYRQVEAMMKAGGRPLMTPPHTVESRLHSTLVSKGGASQPPHSHSVLVHNLHSTLVSKGGASQPPRFFPVRSTCTPRLSAASLFTRANKRTNE